MPRPARGSAMRAETSRHGCQPRPHFMLPCAQTGFERLRLARYSQCCGCCHNLQNNIKHVKILCCQYHVTISVVVTMSLACSIHSTCHSQNTVAFTMLPSLLLSPCLYHVFIMLIVTLMLAKSQSKMPLAASGPIADSVA